MDRNKEISKGLDILLVIAPPFLNKMPSIGVAYLAAYLKYKRYRVEVLDLSLILYNKASAELKSYWQIDCVNSYFVTEIADNLFNAFQKDIMDFVNNILSRDIKIIGFSVNVISIFLANKIAKLIKSRDSSRIIIFGGAGVFSERQRKLIEAGYVDFFVIGEGEETLIFLLDRLYKGKKINSGPGILLGKDLGRCKFLLPPPIENLDMIPFPTYAEFNLPDYNQGSDYKPLPLLMSRGCIKRCTYCIDYIMWQKYRFRSAQYILKEIEYHCRVNAIKAFEFNDLLCNGNLRQLSILCDLIIESGLKFSWVSYAIIRKGMSYELLLKMKRSGCQALIYGLEHTSDNILRRMNKDYTAEDAQEVIRFTHEAGIRTNINIIVGFPGETKDDFNQIVEFLYKNREYIYEVTNVSSCALFPESKLGRFRRRYGVIWKKGSEPMLFKDVFGLDRWIRNERLGKLLNIIEDLGLKKNIVTLPKLNPVAKE